MQCDICFRTGGKAYLCPTDVRNLLYEGRIQNATVLLEKDALDQQITAILSKPTSQEPPQLRTSSADRVDVSQLKSQRSEIDERTQQIIAHAAELRAKVESARNEMNKKKATLARRKSELASAVNGSDARRNRQLEDMATSIRMLKYNWNRNHSTTASSRTFLCGEAAKLYGLKRTRKNGSLEEYKIGGVSIMDLRSLNTASPAQISTALSHIVHLLMLSTHYLAIRLPAEITLPHRDYPLPTIFPLAASYKHKDVPFPGTTPSQSSNNSPSASRHADQPSQPRPRPLFIKKPLPIIAVEDPSAYSLFIEAVTLLAYDIAWLCRSQGIPVGDDSSFDDVCNIGRNLHSLLIGSKPRPPPSSRVSSNQSTPTKQNTETFETTGDKRTVSGTTISTMGKYSHGSAHSFLGSAEGMEFIRSWKLPSPMKLADKLKTRLMGEVANAEWEVLDEDAWAVETDVGGDGVVVGARKDDESNEHPERGIQSFMSMRTVMDAVEMIGGNGGGDGDRKQNVSGWTKLKPR